MLFQNIYSARQELYLSCHYALTPTRPYPSSWDFGMIFHGILSTKPLLYYISCSVSTWNTILFKVKLKYHLVLVIFYPTTNRKKWQIPFCCQTTLHIAYYNKRQILFQVFLWALLFLYKTVKSLSALIIVEVFHSVP